MPCPRCATAGSDRPGPVREEEGPPPQKRSRDPGPPADTQTRMRATLPAFERSPGKCDCTCRPCVLVDITLWCPEERARQAARPQLHPGQPGQRAAGPVTGAPFSDVTAHPSAPGERSENGILSTVRWEKPGVLLQDDFFF